MIAHASGRSHRAVGLSIGLVLLAEAIAVAVVIAHASPLLLPVVTSTGSASFTVAAVNVGAAVVVPLVLGGLVFMTGVAVGPRMRWVESSFSASITVFLIAELNGIRELGALVAIYALTSAAVLFGALRDGGRDPERRVPGIFGAMVGIVPWGLIAWYEIAPVVAGDAGPAAWVRVLTLVMLALFLAASVVAWRTRDSLPGIVLSAVARSVLAWAVVAAIVAGSPIS